jgi:hypothetical protein
MEAEIFSETSVSNYKSTWRPIEKNLHPPPPTQYYVTHESVPGVQVKTMHKEEIRNNKI